MLRITLEEIVVQCLRDFKQQFCINPLALENLVHVKARTVDLLCQPRCLPALLVELGAYKFPYVNLFCHPIPRRTCKTKKALNRFYFAITAQSADQSIANNKRKRFTPKARTLRIRIVCIKKFWSLLCKRQIRQIQYVIFQKVKGDFSPSTISFPISQECSSVHQADACTTYPRS